MFELAGVPEDLAKDAMRLAGHKLPIRTKFVKREGAELMKASEAHNLKDDELVAKLIERQARSSSPCASSTPPASWRTRRGSARRRDVARLLTVAKERGIDLEKELRR